MNDLFLGIDTSNYTTSASLLENGEIIANVKMPVHVGEGERGAKQSDALFSHIKNLPTVMEKIGKADVLALGVSGRPRDVEGSYMPCFLAGVSAASAYSSLAGVPLYVFSHQAGHIRAAMYSSKMPKADKFIAFHVSGGTTEMLLCENSEDGYTIKKIGGTKDINAGQLIDRTGVMLGINFPCGAELEKICDFTGVKARTNVLGTECNLSGLENLSSNMYKKGEPNEKVAAFVIESVRKTLDIMTENALGIYGDLPLLYAGGVMSNYYIKESFSKKYGAYFAEPAFSSDNAAGIALLCSERYYKSLQK